VAQVDSAYGGKTGVDLPGAKNYVGAYHQPAAVIVDPTTLATLPAAEHAAGYAEVVKTALIAGGALWDRVGAGEPVDDALVELWQPEIGFGRCATDAGGEFEFTVAAPADRRFEVMVFARGLLRHLVTRVYFPGADDPFLASLDERARSTLVAEAEADGSLRFDIHLQGERETVFFAV
jgi:protocatechuate 3,4-dioxygenase beta subunit